MEQLPLGDTHAQLESINGDITSQNERFVLSADISDEDFRNLAVDALTTEQQQSVANREVVAEQVDYTEALHGWSVVLDKTDRLVEAAAKIDAATAEIDAQAELSASIAPTIAEQVRALADAKISTRRAELSEIHTELAGLHAQELGYVAICQPWVIPKLPVVYPSLGEVPLSQEAELAPDTTAADVVAESTPRTEPLEDCELRKVLWAVFEHARLAGKDGVRIEEMRKTVPELAGLSPEHYTHFKHNFADMRQQITAMLENMDYPVEWTVSGKTRGTRYHVKELPMTAARRAAIQPVETVKATTSSNEKDDSTPPPPEDTTPPAATPSAPSPVTPTPPPAAPAPSPVAPKPKAVTPTPTPVEAKPVVAPNMAATTESQLDGPTVKIIKNTSGSNAVTGNCTVVEVPLEDFARHLGIKHNPDLRREVKKWIEWLEKNPMSSASRRLKSFPGLNFGQSESLSPLYRFSPKDAPGLTVPRHFQRQRVVYALVGGTPALIEVMEHERFDRVYK